jgi:hypothetical protein
MSDKKPFEEFGTRQDNIKAKAKAEREAKKKKPVSKMKILSDRESEELLDEAMQEEENRRREELEDLYGDVKTDFFEDDVPPPKSNNYKLTAREQAEFLAIIKELGDRRIEALKLFEPAPHQAPFFACHADERIVRGGNRGGKTLSVCVELARALTSQDPYEKFPLTDGRAIVVGKDLMHCSKVLFRKLFKPGAFKIIKDPDTRKWRAFRPWNPWDAANEKLCRPAPPLIPQRFYSNSQIAWENKKDEIARTVRFTTGWELSFFSSLGAPPQGWDVDLALFDEEIEHHAWYPEIAARLLDRRKKHPAYGHPVGGKFLWSATPQAATQVLYDLCNKAKHYEEEGTENPPTVEFYMNLLDNQHITDEAKNQFIGKMANNEDEYRVRILGEFAITGIRVYSECQPKGIHGIKAFPIPENWTIYCAIDPGRQVCAVLFMAIPDPSSQFAGQKILFDELYIRRSNAHIFAEKLKEKIGDRHVMDWVIDHHAARITEMGSGETVGIKYSKALAKQKVGCVRRGNRFLWSNDDVNGGIEAVRTGLHIVDGKSEWLIMHERLPNFIHELERYSYKRTPSGVVTDQPLQVNNHLMDCWRYLAQAKFKWERPQKPKKRKGYVQIAMERKKQRALAAKHGPHSIMVGPGLDLV